MASLRSKLYRLQGFNLCGKILPQLL